MLQALLDKKVEKFNPLFLPTLISSLLKSYSPLWYFAQPWLSSNTKFIILRKICYYMKI